MRVIRADEEFIVAGELHHQRQHSFLGIRADPDVAREVLARRTLHPRSMSHVLVAVVEAFKPFAHPPGGSIDRGNPQPWKTLEHSVIDHRGERYSGVLDYIH